MKLALLSIWLALPLMLAGCKQVTAPLPAWAPNAQVALAGSVISSANAVVVGYEQDQKDCAGNPSLTKCPGVSNVGIHAAIQKIQFALTLAQPSFDEWETALKMNALTPEPAALTSNVSTIQTALAQLPTLTGGAQ